MTDTDTKPFGGYGFAIRTFWIEGTDLTVSRRWRREEYGIGGGDRFSTSIEGKAVSEKDDVCVIGKSDRETKEFALTIKSDEHAKQEWDHSSSIEALVAGGDKSSTPELRVKFHAFETFSKNSPTATLFVMDDDWEIGSKGGWSIECAIPSSVLAQFEAELLVQRVHKLFIGIEWKGGLVRDEHAPPSVPTSWGLFTIAETPEPLRGYVNSIGWRVSDESAAPEKSVSERQQPSRRNIEEEVDRLSVVLADRTLALKRVCILGFFAVLVLILASHFLR
jgi:hypothetical protein